MKKAEFIFAAIVFISTIGQSQIYQAKKNSPIKIQNNKLKEVLLKSDIELNRVEFLILNPGENKYSPYQEIFTTSNVRLKVYYKNVGKLAISPYGLEWKVIEGPVIISKTISGTKVLYPGDEDWDIVEYFGAGRIEKGDYELKIRFDNSNRLNEISKENNVLSSQFTVSQSTIFNGLPDLRFVGVIPTKDTLRSCGNSNFYYFDATVINDGSFPAYIHGNNVISAEAPLKTKHNTGYYINILPKEKKTIQFENTSRDGSTQNLRFTIDKWQQLKESDEANNDFLLEFSVSPIDTGQIGDLTVEEASIEYTSNNKLYWLNVKIKNSGKAKIKLCPEQIICKSFDAPSFLINTWTTNNYPVYLSAGDVYKPSGSATKNLPEGTYKFSIIVDPNNNYPETEENNNSKVFILRVPEDLIIR